MIKFISRRLLQLIPILLVVSIMIFLLLRCTSIDPAIVVLRLSNIPVTDAALAEVRHNLGLDLPVPVQYWNWLTHALRLDFGKSYVTGKGALDEILFYLPTTLKLAGAALAFTLLVSIPLGIFAAVKKDRWFDAVARVFSFVAVSMPSFWFGFLLIYFFAVKLSWLPAMGREGGFASYVMPIVTLSLMSVGINARMIRTGILEHMHTRSVQYCRLRGLDEKTIVYKHVFKNAIIPVMTSVGMHLGELIGGSVIVENIFAWPGVGRYAVSAIYNHDYPVIQCFLLMMTLVFVLCNLLVDICYAALDPRIRYEGVK